jgi:Flp pilus assembly protein TadG
MCYHAQSHPDRKAAVTVEFAFIAPIFAMVVMGIVEVSSLLDTKTDLSLAAREGARMALMDREGFVPTGTSTNDKVIQDIRNLLNANSLCGDCATIQIVDPTDHATPFDLDDPANERQLFELRIQVPYAALTSWYQSIGGSNTMEAFVVFRNGRIQSAS